VLLHTTRTKRRQHVLNFCAYWKVGDNIVAASAATGFLGTIFSMVVMPLVPSIADRVEAVWWC
jgi:hypothetical protein